MTDGSRRPKILPNDEGDESRGNDLTDIENNAMDLRSRTIDEVIVGHNNHFE